MAGRGFEQAGIDGRVAAAMAAVHGAAEPSAAQAAVVRQLARPRSHLMVRQATGTGKTYAVAAALVSLAVQEHRALTERLGQSAAAAFAAQALNTLVVVPNRELALQIERWGSELLAHAYPAAPRAKFIQRFVSGGEYEAAQRGVLRRHGAPAIAVGTPRCLLELALLRPAAPALLRWLADAPPGDAAEYLQRLKRVHGLCRQGRGLDSVAAFGGLRRLVVDEIDQVLRLPGPHAPEREKRLRRDKPRPGQVLGHDPVLGAQEARAPMPERPAERLLRSLGHVVGPRTVQVTALSATAGAAEREWMRARGWMASAPVWIDNAEARVVVPPAVTHHCLVVEDGRIVRNLRPKRANLEAEPKEEEEPDQDTEQIPMMEIMAEAAANAIEQLRPGGSVVVFTRPDASTARFGRVLERYGVLAQDVMARFDPRIAQPGPGPGPEPGPEPRRVLIACEEAARGIDLPDASLVLILDIPRSAASYAHMAGRTARFGRAGTVVSVVPAGARGCYEGKMRGIFARLGIEPAPAPFVAA
ncbi:hypothetical protein H4R18_005959 [Coemansia javaensis]|uniref:ATP-dependent RNA helicase n=1 Tax=Coemansia javaensis TaxID=2761396 RepID=A0A9W8H752_9FUNG|nr:hypothetical protein H4R18_005959 [Coemansia javaensis]